MSYAESNPYQTWGLPAAEADTSDRASFIRKTYLHLFGAILAFIGLEAALVASPVGEWLASTLFRGGNVGWLIVLGAFVGVSWLASSWANSATSVATQYLGLGLYVVAEAVIFAPLIWLAVAYGQQNLILQAAILTGVIFCGLTLIVFATGADFSFLRTALSVAIMAALVTIVASMIFGFSLGILFIGAMILIASGYILYDTSNVLHHYRIGQHVAAALALFASVALLFWYVLQLLMSLSNRD